MKCGLCSKKKTRDALPSALPPVKLATPPIRNNDNPAIKTLPNGLQKDTSKTSLTAAEPTYENLDDPELWARAYTSLKTRQEQLVQEFEQYVKSLSSSDNSTPTGDDANERPFDAALVEEVYEKRKKELEDGQWGVKFHGQKVVVRKQVERLFRFAIWSDKIITPALSAQPAAAMAWSAVSIALPVDASTTMMLGYDTNIPTVTVELDTAGRENARRIQCRLQLPTAVQISNRESSTAAAGRGKACHRLLLQDSGIPGVCCMLSGQRKFQTVYTWDGNGG